MVVPMIVPHAAAERTRLVRRAIGDAGYRGRVTSTPASHTAKLTHVHDCGDPAAVAAYLSGYFHGMATATASATAATVTWSA